MTVDRDPDYLDEPVVYLCKYADHTHTLKARRKVIIDGEAIIDPGVRMVFKKNRCVVRDANIVKLMEHAMKYTGIGKLIKRGPTKTECDRAATAAKEVEKAKQGALKKFGDTKPKEPSSFADMLEKKKESNLVSGTRGVT